MMTGGGWGSTRLRIGVCDSRFGGRQVAEAGCAWLGPGFMRSDERRNLCDCRMARCLSIGYVG